MKLILYNNKNSWIVCGVSLLIAVIAFAILPEMIPNHITGGIADNYSSRIGILLFPLIQAVLLLICEIKALKYWSMNFKSGFVKNEIQYYGVIFCAVIIILLGEIGIIAASLLR